MDRSGPESILMKKSIIPNNPGSKNQKPIKQVGLLGGTFDPIHRGHLQAAKTVLKAFSLDRILFIPSSRPPHKRASGLTDSRNRLEMLRLALSKHPRLTYSDIEIQRPGVSYTIDTVKALINTSPAEIQFYLIIGHDAFFEIHTWKAYQDLFRILPFILLIRPGAGDPATRNIQKLIGLYLRRNISPRYRFSTVRSGFFHPDLHPVYVIPNHLLDISSTSIRTRIKNGLSIQSMVPREVMKWISQTGLYR
jgi:nicotinate-nucleotide adenylyltransferase